MLIQASNSAAARWAARLVTLLVWALALASVVVWGLKATAVPGGPQPAVQASGGVPLDTGAVARLLGASALVNAAAPVVNPSSRFVLSGVIAGRGGAALIAVDGKPPKPYRVGSVVDGDLLLQSVAPRRVELAQRMDGPASFALEMPMQK